MLQKVRRWNGNNQISSCLLPALTSIISFCRLPTTSTVAKRQRGENAAPPQPSGRPERTDARCQEKKEARGEKNLHKGGVGKADLVPGRAPAWKRRLGGSPSTARGLEAVGDAKARWQSCRSHPRCVCGMLGLRAAGEASSPLPNMPQHFTMHRLSAPAFFQILVFGKSGGCSVQGLFSSLFFGRGMQFSTKVIYNN